MRELSTNEVHFAAGGNNDMFLINMISQLPKEQKERIADVLVLAHLVLLSTAISAIGATIIFEEALCIIGATLVGTAAGGALAYSYYDY